MAETNLTPPDGGQTPGGLGKPLADGDRLEALFEATDRLAALDDPPLTEAEVEAEIAAAREERRSNAR